jgi:hypothetical protein
MERDTGSGKIEHLEDGSTLLFNYNIDGDAPKAEHRAWLDNHVITDAKASPNGLSVVIDGTTDRLGDAEYNIGLSRRRTEAVMKYLRGKLPNYPWDFKPDWQGEAKAERKGDPKGLPNEVYRAVLIRTLKPGEPVPPRPNIPSVWPHKPKEFPRPPRTPPLLPSTCIVDDNCPVSQEFHIKLIAGATAGEIVEGVGMFFMIQDTTNRLECMYSLKGAGLASPGPPINPAVAGSPKSFRTSEATKVTRFGPLGGILQVTGAVGFPPFIVPKTVASTLSFSFKGPNSPLPKGTVTIGDFDTGLISIPGGGIHGGHFQPLTLCRGKSGANKI